MSAKCLKRLDDMNKAVFLLGSVFLLLGVSLFFYVQTDVWYEKEYLGSGYFVNGVYYGNRNPKVDENGEIVWMSDWECWLNAKYVPVSEWERYGITFESRGWKTIENSVSYMPYRLYGVIFLVVGLAVFVISFFVPTEIRHA